MYFLGFFGKSEKRYAGMSETWKFRGVEFWDENMIFSETWVNRIAAIWTAITVLFTAFYSLISIFL